MSCLQTYHYRLVATNSLGTTYGADKVFAPPVPAEQRWIHGGADILWSNPLNWGSSVPSRVGTIPFPGDDVYVGDDYTGGVNQPTIMDIDYSGVKGLKYIKAVDGNDPLRVCAPLKWTVESFMGNGGSGANDIIVERGGSLDGPLRITADQDRPTFHVTFAGGGCLGGWWRFYDTSRANCAFQIPGTLPAGVPIKPSYIAEMSRPNPAPGFPPVFEFVLDAAGVTPIQLTDSNPIRLAGGASPGVYQLTVNMGAYTGPAVAIPLFTLDTADTDRLFKAGNITIANPPMEGAPWTVVQTDRGVSVVPTALVITCMSYDAIHDQLTLTWNSVADALYTIEVTEQFIGNEAAGSQWDVVAINIGSGGVTTTGVIEGPTHGKFYRIKKQ